MVVEYCWYSTPVWRVLSQTRNSTERGSKNVTSTVLLLVCSPDIYWCLLKEEHDYKINVVSQHTIVVYHNNDHILHHKQRILVSSEIYINNIYYPIYTPQDNHLKVAIVSTSLSHLLVFTQIYQTIVSFHKRSNWDNHD